MLLNDEIIELANLPERAQAILKNPDRQIKFQLRKHTPKGRIIDCYLVYHSTARGPPCKGGIRMSDGVSLEETTRLAEIMTYKNSLMGLPFGGGKGGIKVSSSTLPELKETVISGYAHEIREELYSGAYVPAPDLGTGPRQMADIFDVTHIRSTVTGKPVGIGGIPGRKEATGFGIKEAAEIATRDILNTEISDLTVAVQGFGNVGAWTSKFLEEAGAKIVSISTTEGAIYNEDGIDISKCFESRKHLGDKCTLECENAEKIDLGSELLLDVDILIPAATSDAITKEVAENLQADLVVEGANAPTTNRGDRALRERDIPVVPDILANAGGVVASYAEWRGAKSGSKTKKRETYQVIRENIHEAFDEVLDISTNMEIPLRKAAMVASARRLKETMKGRGWI